jgi:hypothetical protein
MLVFVVLVAAIAVVLLTSLIKNVNWSSKHKNLVATVLSVLAASIMFVSVTPLATLSGTGVLSIITSVYGTSQLLYQFILNGTGLERKLAGTDVEEL